MLPTIPPTRLPFRFLLAFAILVMFVCFGTGSAVTYQWAYAQGQGDPVLVSSVETETVTVVDTVYTPGPTVTVNLPVPTATPTGETAYVPRAQPSPGDSTETEETEKTSDPGMVEVAVNDYTETYQDSLITATFNARVAGEMLSWNFEYELIFPTITRTITETVTITNTVQPPPPSRFSFGASVSVIYVPEIDYVDSSTGPYVAARLGKSRLTYSPRISPFTRRVSHLLTASTPF